MWEKVFNALSNVPAALSAVVVVVLGALFNAHLNRRRDDRLRREDAKATATALRAELSAIRATLLRNAEVLDNRPASETAATVGPDLSHQVRVLPAILSKLTLLEGTTIQSVMDAYAVIEQHSELVLLLGAIQQERGTRRQIIIPATQANRVAELNRNTANQIDQTLTLLTTFID